MVRGDLFNVGDTRRIYCRRRGVGRDACRVATDVAMCRIPLVYHEL